MNLLGKETLELMAMGKDESESFSLAFDAQVPTCSMRSDKTNSA